MPLEAPDFSRVRVHELLNLVEGDSVLATVIIKVAVDSTRDDALLPTVMLLPSGFTPVIFQRRTQRNSGCWPFHHAPGVLGGQSHLHRPAGAY